MAFRWALATLHPWFPYIRKDKLLTEWVVLVYQIYDWHKGEGTHCHMGRDGPDWVCPHQPRRMRCTLTETHTRSDKNISNGGVGKNGPLTTAPSHFLYGWRREGCYSCETFKLQDPVRLKGPFLYCYSVITFNQQLHNHTRSLEDNIYNSTDRLKHWNIFPPPHLFLSIPTSQTNTIWTQGLKFRNLSKVDFQQWKMKITPERQNGWTGPGCILASVSVWIESK